ncbi:MAG: TolC family protein [Candidatus Wallbacteria bacterium]|nr:TolC family protein [Candidatus Wallbacteria bacterium]
MSFLFAMLVTVLAAAPLPALAAPPTLSLSEAVALAQRNHPRVAGMQARLEGVEARGREVRGESLPRVELQAVHVGGLSGAKGAGLGVQGIVSSQLVADDAVGVNVWQRLYDSGELRHRKRALAHQTGVARGEGEVVQREVGLEAVKAFVEVQAQQALLAVYLDLLSDREAFAAQAEGYLKAGLRTGIDASLARVQVARARGLLAAVTGRRDRARASLDRALGMAGSPDGQTGPGSSAAPPRELVPLRLALPALPALEPLARFARTSRPEMVAARRAVEAAQAEIKAVRATRNLQLVGFLSAGAADTARSRADDFEWAGGVALKLPLDVSSVYGERIGQARARLREAEARLRDAEEQVYLELRQARLEVENLRQQQEVDRQELEQAHLALKMSDEQYRAGLGSFLDRLQAENSVVEASSRLRQREFDSLASWVRLQVAGGATVPEAVAGLEPVPK